MALLVKKFKKFLRYEKRNPIGQNSFQTPPPAPAPQYQAPVYSAPQPVAPVPYQVPPSPTQNLSAPVVSKRLSTEQKMKTNLCYNCRKPRHYQVNCPYPNVSKSSRQDYLDRNQFRSNLRQQGLLAESEPASAPEDLESSDESSDDDEPLDDSALICLMARDDEASPEVINELSIPFSYDELLDKVREYYNECQEAAKIYQNHFTIISSLKNDKVTLKAELQVQHQCIEKN